MTRLVPLLSAWCLLACNTNAPSERAPAPLAPPAAPSASLAIVEADKTVSLDPALLRLDVDANAVTIGGRVVTTLNARAFRDADVRGEHGYLVPSIFDVPELQNEVQPRIALAFDAATPYGTVARVLYTVGKTQRSELHLVVQTSAGQRALPVTLPTFEGDVRMRGPEPEGASLRDVLLGLSPAEEVEDPPSLHRVVLVRRDGVFLRSAGGWALAGCRDVAGAESGPIVPRRDGEIEWRALRECFERIRDDYASAPDLRAALVVADADVPFEEVAQTVATLRGPTDRPLVPDVTLAAPRPPRPPPQPANEVDVGGGSSSTSTSRRASMGPPD
ncbi:MAG: hypothetical protein H6722_12120 [Sandaracinus sp.]|nr:hypothetical protein [Sandaracinus sp.]MCB9613191.1 hypothetical protein [Sandaracinus sp.]